MSSLAPSFPGELADTLAECAAAAKSITLVGNNSKRLMAGPIQRSDVTISTVNLRKLLQYEPNDLTVSVEAGMKFSDLQATLGKHGQMLALDPPFGGDGTVGGVLAADMSGPMRRRFGTARDLVIGMSFATLEGKLIQSGGMVVKNVAGLDMGKMLIGSFGTLAAIATVNFRLHPLPEGWRTFLFSSIDLESALTKRDAVLGSVLQPTAIDLISPAAAARFGRRGYLLAIRASGSTAVLDRYERELAGSEMLTGPAEELFWSQVREFTPDFLLRRASGVVLRINTSLRDVGVLLRMATDPCIVRAGSGVAYLYLASFASVPVFWRAAQTHKWSCVIEFGPNEIRGEKELTPAESSPERQNSFAMMKSVKQMFDPRALLNTGRLYGRI